MSNQLTIHQDHAPAQWGDRQEVAAVAKRIKAMLPGGERLSDQQAFAAGQYALISGLDPFSGGFYAMPGGGIVSHYAVLVAWAQKTAPYSDKYFPLSEGERAAEGVPAGEGC